MIELNYNKYGASKMTYNGIKFDSKRELKRYIELELLQRVKEISSLELQKTFVLIPTQYIDGKCAERSCTYTADFVYIDNRTGELVVEDTKGFKTKDYIIKRKLMLHIYGIRIKEV